MNPLPLNSLLSRIVSEVPWVLSICLIFGGAVAVAPARQARVRNQVTRGQQAPFGGYAESPVDAERRLNALNNQRHKTMISDANKLLQTTKDLDVEIAANISDQFTPDELRKITTIEKLAHSVKEKMALSFDGGPQPRDPMYPPGLPGGPPIGP